MQSRRHYQRAESTRQTSRSWCGETVWHLSIPNDCPCTLSTLCASASRAKSENNVSDASNTLTKKRNNLCPHIVNDMMFVRSNHDICCCKEVELACWLLWCSLLSATGSRERVHGVRGTIVPCTVVFVMDTAYSTVLQPSKYWSTLHCILYNALTRRIWHTGIGWVMGWTGSMHVWSGWVWAGNPKRSCLHGPIGPPKIDNSRLWYHHST